MGKCNKSEVFLKMFSLVSIKLGRGQVRLGSLIFYLNFVYQCGIFLVEKLPPLTDSFIQFFIGIVILALGEKSLRFILGDELHYHFFKLWFFVYV